MAQKKTAPDTLPADFDFSSAPDTLPANFDFGQSAKPATPIPDLAANPSLTNYGASQAQKYGVQAQPVTQFEKDRDPNNQQGFLANHFAGLKNLLQLPSAQNPYPLMGLEQKQQTFQQAQQEGQQERQAGYSAPYRAATIPFSAIGGNTQGVEQQADIGNPAGVLGQATAPLTGAAALDVAGRGVSKGFRMATKVDPAANLAAAADTGGAPKAGVSTYQDHAAPGLQSFQDALSQEGIKPSDFNGRQGPQKAVQAAQRVVANAQEQAAPYLKQIENRPVGELGEQVAKKVQDSVDNFDETIMPGVKGQVADIAAAVRQAKTVGELNALRSKFNVLTSKYWSSLPLDATTAKMDAMVTAGNALRDAVYGTAEDVLGVNLKGIKMQEGVGLALERQFARSQNVLDRVANTESAPPTYIQRLRAGETGTAMAKSAIGLDAPSKLELFNTQMQRVAQGVDPLTFRPKEPVGAPGGVTFQGQPAAGVDVPAFLRQKGITLPEYQTMRANGIPVEMMRPSLTKTRGLLSSGATQLPSSTEPLGQPSAPPPVAATTRAQRMRLLLPEKAGGNVPQPAVQPGSPLWVILQKAGIDPFPEP